MADTQIVYDEKFDINTLKERFVKHSKLNPLIH